MPHAGEFDVRSPLSYTGATLQNSWVNFGPGFEPAGYLKDSEGFVRLTGLVKDGSAFNATIFTLPAGLRPAQRLVFVALAANAISRIDVQTDGQVAQANIGATTPYVSLEGITFRATA